MQLRKSQFIHQLPVGPGRVLLVHAVSHLRLSVDQEVSDVVDYFGEPRTLPDDYDGLAKVVAYDRATLEGSIKSLVERGILTALSAEQELAAVSAKLGATHGRDPLELLERYRRELKEGSESYWAAGTSYRLSDFKGDKKRVDVVLLGDADLQMESDFLRREAAQRGIDLRIAATFPDDVRFVSEHKHDVVLIGALRSRHTITADPGQNAAHAGYIAEASHILEQLRERTSAPILIDNLPEPTVQPLGLAERGLNGHRMRFRMANAVLANLVESFPDVHVVDVAAALGAIGSERMLDDGLVGFTHLGSPGWLLQRPERKGCARNRSRHDAARPTVGADPYCREAAIARAHTSMRSWSFLVSVARNVSSSTSTVSYGLGFSSKPSLRSRGIRPSVAHSPTSASISGCTKHCSASSGAASCWPV